MFAVLLCALFYSNEYQISKCDEQECEIIRYR
jgi:hypothetical protein